MSGRYFQFHLRRPLAFASGAAELDIELCLGHGQWLALQGPSGAGKTSLLRLLAGLESPESGHVAVDGEIWLDTARKLSLPTRRRQIGVVFQEHALFPHMTARQQLEFAYRRGTPRTLASELLALVGLTGLAERYPSALSGGQKQRLALARALAGSPRVLLLDEPLSALDPELRHSMQALLRRIRDEQRVDYAILVTHDIDEADHLADRIVRLQLGRVVSDDPKTASISASHWTTKESSCPAAAFF